MLAFSPKQLSYSRSRNSLPVVFSKADIEGLRYSVDGIRGYFLWIGSVYRIEVRNHEGRIMKIRFWSLYGIRRNALAEKYTGILNEMYRNYFNDLVVHYITLLDNGMAFSLAGVGLSPGGIDDLKMGEVPWNRVALKSYTNYYALFDTDQPANYRSFDYGMEWNAAILFAVVYHAVRRQSLQPSFLQ